MRQTENEMNKFGHCICQLHTHKKNECTFVMHSHWAIHFNFCNYECKLNTNRSHIIITILIKIHEWRKKILDFFFCSAHFCEARAYVFCLHFGPLFQCWDFSWAMSFGCTAKTGEPLWTNICNSKWHGHFQFCTLRCAVLRTAICRRHSLLNAAVSSTTL